MKSALHYSHELLDNLIQRFSSDLFIDATLGNGNDLAFILKHPHFKGQILGFDIQTQAIDKTKQKLKDLHLDTKDNYQLIQDSHANLNQYISNETKIGGAIFNLGYLPGGNHDITTLFDSTIQAIETISTYLNKHGQIILVVYHGHEEGKVESEQLLNALSQWPQEKWQVLTYQFINQINRPPYLIVVEKIN